MLKRVLIDLSMDEDDNYKATTPTNEGQDDEVSIPTTNLQ